MVSMKRFKMGCRRDKKDARDYLMRAYLPVVKLPKKIDYTSKMTPVRDQGDEGTCVAFSSAAGMKEYQEQIDWKKYMELSPRFLYSLCKKIDGAPGSEGTQIRFAMKALKEYGVCEEKYWPYRPHQDNGPKSGAAADAKKFKELAYARILGLDELKLSLAAKGPCVIGIVCFEGIMKTRTGKVPVPGPGARPLGGHAICAVGYDDAAKLLKFKNSWSGAWGDKGYGYLPYTYVNKYMMDAWSAVDIKDAIPMTIGKVEEFLIRGAEIPGF
jgi:C1A family cysteine protease